MYYIGGKDKKKKRYFQEKHKKTPKPVGFGVFS